LTAEIVRTEMDENAPDVAISYNFITKGQPEDLAKAVKSLYETIYREGDECIVVDTGSKPTELKRLREALADFPNLRILERPKLSVNYRAKILEYMGPKRLQEFKKGMGSSKGVRSFAAARQVAFDASTKDLVFWMDSDDILVDEEPGNFRKVINMVYKEKPYKLDALLLDYHYNFAEDGTITTVLRRERIVPRATYYWKGACHEVLIPKPGVPSQNTGFFQDLKAHIRHTDARKPHLLSDIRNYVLLRTDMEREVAETGGCDPRTIYYLGNSARGLGHRREAIRLYKEFNTYSGSCDDRLAALFYIAGIYLQPEVQRPHDAIDMYMECIKVKPNDPRGYFGLQRAYYLIHRHKESLKWFQIGTQHKMPPDQLMSYDPTYMEYHPHIIAAFACRELGQHQMALDHVRTAGRNRPNFKETQELFKIFQDYCAGHDLSAAVQILTENSTFSAKELVASLQSVPGELEKFGLGHLEIEGRAKRPEIVIFCGAGNEEWGPGSRKAGIGGSEKMVIILAEALQRTGKVNVSVYADVPVDMRGVQADTGVAYFHWSQFDEERPREVLVAWRSPELLTRLKVPARKRVLWMHDVQDPSRYNDEILSLVDFVQVQSKFHGQPLIGVVPDEKIWIARNALEIPEKSDLPRDPKQVLFCSSPDRGLQTAIKIVREARKVDPEISLVVTYGVTPWARKAFATNPHRHCPDLGHSISMDLYERQCHELLDEIGATVLNRVSFKKMEILMQTSGVWLYPTRFPEISCMSAMEAQANGCVPLATRYGALATTLLPECNALSTHLPAIPGTMDIPDKYFEATALQLLEATQVPADSFRRKDMATAAQNAFDVDSLAREWLSKLGLGEGSDTAAGRPLQKPLVQAAESTLDPEGALIIPPGSGENHTNFFCDMEKAMEVLNSNAQAKAK